MYSSKVFYLFCVILLSLGAFCRSAGLTPRGAAKELSGDSRKEALDLLDASLTKLVTGNGPNYKITKVTSVKGQTVAGTLNTFQVELTHGDEAGKDCTVKIWTQPWLTENGTNIKIQCTGDDTEQSQTW
ncbi:uncharacterized protein Dwil_GK11742 [Drosophila willistoni]|uniref:Cystatin domain-containing protein n=1 Tax=Drosophila willistoni TaxID=7260 RepID=B4NAM1_DROWI|nr:cystatin-like protein [Drosophila willistoni]EDW80835.1 uncharacterized protein Dwil_GK11742 [Drosophila willistoni]